MTQKEHLSSAANPGHGFSGNGQYFQVEHKEEKNKAKKTKPQQERENQTAVRRHLTSHSVYLFNIKNKKALSVVFFVFFTSVCFLQIVASATF